MVVVSKFESLEVRLALASDPLVILPLGDSIVQGEYSSDIADQRSHGYRMALQERLVEAEIEFDFVGSRNEPCYFSEQPTFASNRFDPDHEGHWGWRADEILTGRSELTCGDVDSGSLVEWIDEYEVQPDIVLLHLGTNDIIQALPDSWTRTQNDLTESQAFEIAMRIQAVVETLVANIDNPDLEILVAKIVPGSAITHEVAAVNQQIQVQLAGHPHVTIVDQFLGFHAVTMTYDHIHPNSLGQAHIASRWFEAIQSIRETTVAQQTVVTGDFDANSVVDATDIDLLQAAIGDDSESFFDLTGDMRVDDADVTELVEEVIGTRRGDANLDGTVNFADFLTVARSFNQAGGWSSGDFTGDGFVSFIDFLVCARNFESRGM